MQSYNYLSAFKINLIYYNSQVAKANREKKRGEEGAGNVDGSS